MNILALTPDEFITGLTVWTAALTTAIGILSAFVLKNWPAIQAIIIKIQSLEKTADTHTEQIAANTAAIIPVALATPPAPTPVAAALEANTVATEANTEAQISNPPQS